jgi:hypothetical protein
MEVLLYGAFTNDLPLEAEGRSLRWVSVFFLDPEDLDVGELVIQSCIAPLLGPISQSPISLCSSYERSREG